MSEVGLGSEGRWSGAGRGFGTTRRPGAGLGSVRGQGLEAVQLGRRLHSPKSSCSCLSNSEASQPPAWGLVC